VASSRSENGNGGASDGSRWEGARLPIGCVATAAEPRQCTLEALEARDVFHPNRRLLFHSCPQARALPDNTARPQRWDLLSRCREPEAALIFGGDSDFFLASKHGASTNSFPQAMRPFDLERSKLPQGCRKFSTSLLPFFACSAVVVVVQRPTLPLFGESRCPWSTKYPRGPHRVRGGQGSGRRGHGPLAAWLTEGME
jgi:hypothetical protein